MEATQAQLLNLLDGKKQFTIPIYQRTYSWQHSQCLRKLTHNQHLTNADKGAAREKSRSGFHSS